MRHYVVVFLESSMFPGTWMADHFVRDAEREDVPELPEFLGASHSETLKLLKDWQNVSTNESVWTLEEVLLSRVAMARLTALWFSSQKLVRRIVQYPLTVLH